MSRFRSRRHHTRVGKRAGELLRTRRMVWVAVILVNVAAAVAARRKGVLIAAQVAVAAALATSLVARLAGYLGIHRGRLVIRHQRPSPRRVAALVLAVFVASLLAALAAHVASILVDELQRPAPESAS